MGQFAQAQVEVSLLLLLQWQHRDLPNRRAGANCKVTAPTKVKRAKQTDQSVNKSNAFTVTRALHVSFYVSVSVSSLGFSFRFHAVDLLSRREVFTFIFTLCQSLSFSLSVSPAHTQLTHMTFLQKLAKKSSRVVAMTSLAFCLSYNFRRSATSPTAQQPKSSAAHRFTDSPTLDSVDDPN